MRCGYIVQSYKRQHNLNQLTNGLNDIHIQYIHTYIKLNIKFRYISYKKSHKVIYKIQRIQ